MNIKFNPLIAVLLLTTNVNFIFSQNNPARKADLAFSQAKKCVESKKCSDVNCIKENVSEYNKIVIENPSLKRSALHLTSYIEQAEAFCNEKNVIEGGVGMGGFSGTNKIKNDLLTFKLFNIFLETENQFNEIEREEILKQISQLQSEKIQVSSDSVEYKAIQNTEESLLRSLKTINKEVFSNQESIIEFTNKQLKLSEKLITQERNLNIKRN